MYKGKYEEEDFRKNMVLNHRIVNHGPSHQGGSPHLDPAGNRTTQSPAHHRKETTCSGMEMSPVYQVWPKQSGLAKTILQGTVKGGRRRGRQRNRWEDNIREWTGLEFAKSRRALENREKWKKLVVKLS